MLIFIDSNIFFNNWYLDNANFKSFLNYIDKTDSKILISEIVCDEIDNKFMSELATLKKNIETGINRSKQLLDKSIELDLSLFNMDYSLKKVITKKTEKAIFIPYNDISNSTLVKRAIKRIKPFQDKDKGFRDTLIWLSIIKHLEKINGNENVVIINNNSSDFFTKDKTDLHSDLKNDIKVSKIENTFKVYKSINDFISDKVEAEHQNIKIDDFLEKYIYPNEEVIEQQIEYHIEFESIQWFNDLLRESSPDFKNVNYISDYNFSIIEGIEDLELLNWSFLDKDSIYAELQFFLRIVNIRFTIPRLVYDDARFNLNKNFPDAEVNKDFALIDTFRKVSMNTSFNINIYDESASFDDLSINEFRI
jgi:hypothetical protein